MSPEICLLASDLDGTLIPGAGSADDGGIPRFREAVEARPGLLLAYVTGRHRRLALDGIAAHGLPPADVLVCDVGTSVYIRGDGGYAADPQYRRRMVEASGGVDVVELRRRLESLTGLRPQESEKQAEFKLSFYTPPGTEGRDLAIRAEGLVTDAGGRANVVYSVEPDTGRGLLDVLPAGVAKDVAVRYLRDRFVGQQEGVVYAGDSGNDRAAMLSGFNAVVVGNAAAWLKEDIRREAARLGLQARIHFARASYARGVLEGARHFGVL